jgi:hypothetical protein
MKIYCFWTGANELTENRKICLEQFQKTCGGNVILVTASNLHEYILKDHPLHAAYEYLSETQKSDYLRAYFMHFYGGGYSDIKRTTGSWVNAFNELMNDDNKWICGYPEVNGGVAYQPLINHWREMIGCGAYICKPQTPLTFEWYNDMLALMDLKLEKLKLYPARYPQDHKPANAGINYQGYPIEWAEFNLIYQRLIYKYKEHLLNALPISIFQNYR